MQEAFSRLRQGVGTPDDWRRLHDAVRDGLRLANAGIMRGVAGHLQAAQTALTEIERRARELGLWPIPHLAEIEAIDTAVDLIDLQLRTLGHRARHAHAAE